MTEKKALPLIGNPCQMGDCANKGIYILPGSCLNCGAEFRVQIRKGHDAPLAVECPKCECTTYSWRRGDAE